MTRPAEKPVRKDAALNRAAVLEAISGAVLGFTSTEAGTTVDVGRARAAGHRCGMDLIELIAALADGGVVARARLIAHGSSCSAIDCGGDEETLPGPPDRPLDARDRGRPPRRPGRTG